MARALLSVSVAPELKAALEARAVADGVSMTGFVVSLLESELGSVAQVEAVAALAEAPDLGAWVELAEEPLLVCPRLERHRADRPCRVCGV